MATLHISYLAGTQYGVAKGTMGYESVTTSSSNAAGTGNPDASIAMLYGDAAHFVKVGTAATATNGMYVPSSQVVFVALDSGQAINAITA